MIRSQLEIFEKINPKVCAINGYQEHVEQVSIPGNNTFFMIPQHGDFSLVNLRYNFESKRISIIDWADFGKTCLPLFDAFLLLVSSYIHRVTCSAFLTPGTIEKTFVRSLHCYLDEFGIRKECVPDLFVIFLITFFNQNYLSGRKETAAQIYDLFLCYLKNPTMHFIAA